MRKLSGTQTSRAPTRAKIYLFPTLDQRQFAVRKLPQRTQGNSDGNRSIQKGDVEVRHALTQKLAEAVSRLLAAGKLGDVARPGGKKTTTFIIPADHLERELQELNDPALTQELLVTTLREARSQREPGKSRRKRSK
jgi:hypothetical protein